MKLGLDPKPGQVLKDPWARFEAWRHHPQLSPMRNLKGMFPGFTWGVGAFLVAITIEKIFFDDKKKGGGHH